MLFCPGQITLEFDTFGIGEGFVGFLLFYFVSRRVVFKRALGWMGMEIGV